MSEMASSSGLDEDASDPLRVVRRVVDELKAQGTFDLIRAECLADVDTKPAYQNVRSRVESCVSRFLDKQADSWKPTSNKSQLRNQLRQYIQESTYMATGLERSVEQSVNPRVESRIRPAIESILFKYLGIDEEASEDPAHQQEGSEAPNGSDAVLRREEKTRKRYDDVIMDEKSLIDVTSPNLKGNISPLTPKKSLRESSDEIGSNSSSPKTPPLPPPMPPLPPLPPPFIPPLPPEGEVSLMPSTTPVDYRESEERETPPPPPPGVEDEVMLEKPTTPVIDASQVANTPPEANAIQSSDAEMKSGGSDGELAELERTRAALQAKLAAASLGSSDEASGTTNEEATASENDETVVAPHHPRVDSVEGECVEDKAKKEKDKKDKDKGDEKCERPMDVSNNKSRGDDDDDNSTAKNSNQSTSHSSNIRDTKANDRKVESTNTDKSQRREDKPNKGHTTSKSDESRRHHHKRRHSDQQESTKKRRRQDSSATNKKAHESAHKTDVVSKNDGIYECAKGKGKKEKEMLKLKRSKEQLERIEQKIKEKSNLKSNKFRDFDMFAPKPPKPKYLPPARNKCPQISTSGAHQINNACTKSGSKQGDTLTLSTDKEHNNLKHATTRGCLSKQDENLSNDNSSSSDALRDRITTSKEGNQKKSGVESPVDSLRAPRKVFPELPVSKSTGDKLKQHEDDIAAAKARLEQARARKLVELRTKELEKKRLRRSHSSSLEENSDSESGRGRKRPSPLDETPRSKGAKRAKKDNGSSGDDIKRSPSTTLKLHQRKKLSLADLEGSDEDDISDWEGDAKPTLFNRTLNKARRNDGNGSGLKVATRQSRMRQLIDAQLKTDPQTSLRTHLTQPAADSNSKTRVEKLRSACEQMETSTDIHVAGFVLKDEISHDGFIYIDPSCSSVTPKELVTHLKYHYGGNPTLVPKMPTWLVEVLLKWHLFRHHVNLCFDLSPSSSLKIVGEREYNNIIRRRFNENIATGQQDNMPFAGFSEAVIEDAYNHFQSLSDVLLIKDVSEKDGDAFGMNNCLDSDIVDGDQTDNFGLVEVVVVANDKEKTAAPEDGSVGTSRSSTASINVNVEKKELQVTSSKLDLQNEQSNNNHTSLTSKAA